MNSVGLAEAAGAYLRRCRRENGLTLEAIARTARKHGASWSLSSVRAFENGNAAPTLPTLLIVALTVSELTGNDVRLADLFSDSDTFDFPKHTSRASISRDWLEAVLAGGPVRPGPGTPGGPLTAQSNIDDLPALALKRAAEKLEISTEALEHWAVALWGVGFQDEMRRRADLRSSPQARGHITRSLVTEIREAMASESSPASALPAPESAPNHRPRSFTS
ncbi:helix-turn-helix domain-containing protein [Microbacterium sp. WCS2018Hpa-9]|nr:helix-turn-helix domain-containing protein [Microbacterium sp. WCS2018Hpa-9]